MSQIFLMLGELDRSISGMVTWLWLPINCLLLFIDGVIYTCVGLSYRLFQLMAQLNFNALSSWMTALIDRINAIIAVLILFILGYSLIQYLINPEKANDKSKAGGVAILKNIAISAILLISYGFIFGVLNEFTFILVGTPSTYKYTYLNDLFGVENNGGDEGLIMRLIVGGEETLESGTKVDYGRKLAITTLSSFLHGYEDEGLYNREEGWEKSILADVYNEAMEADDFNLIGSLVTVVGEVGRSIYYFPIISSALGAYIVFTIVKAALDLGVRAFKLIILQIIAPVAIVSIMKDGIGQGNKVFSSYMKALTTTYTDAFIRIGSMYFAFAFISVAYNNLDQLFAGAPKADGFTKMCLYGLIIVSALKLGKELPKLIDEIFKSHLADDKKAGLGQFLTAAGGVALGGAVGGLSGMGTRWKNSRNAGMGVLRSGWNAAVGGYSGMLTGGFSGGVAGARMKPDNLSGILKGGADIISEGRRAGAPGIGGFIQGMREEYGYDGAAREKQTIDDLKAVRDQVLKNPANSKPTYSLDFSVGGATRTFTGEFDLAKGSGKAAAAAWKEGEDGRKLWAEIQASSGDKKLELFNAYNGIISYIEGDGFGEASASLLESDTEYVRLAKRAARSTGIDAARFYGKKSGKAIEEAELHQLRKEHQRRRNGYQVPKGGK